MKNDTIFQAGKRAIKHVLAVPKHADSHAQGAEIVLDGGQQIQLTGASVAPDGNIILRETLVKN